MKRNFRQIWILIPAILGAILILQNLSQEPNKRELPYSVFLEQVKSNQVQSVRFLGDGYSIEGVLHSGENFTALRPLGVPDNALMTDLYEHNVHITGEPPKKDSLWVQLFVASFPLLLIGAAIFFFMRQSQIGRNNPLSFGANKAKAISGGKVTTTFKDVAGCDEAVEEVRELVSFLRDPDHFQKLGARIPRGIMMVGPPGTGKTLLARAIAGEANVNFFSISGSDFVEMFVGVGASRVRNMFLQAHQNSPCIVFIDEIDAVGRHRGTGLGGGHDEREQTLNQLLVEMDGFEVDTGVIIIAATNRPDVLDPALLRPGRFDRQVMVDLPDINGREQILKLHLKKIPMASKVDPRALARGTPGFSGADLANIANEAALIAARKHKRVVSQYELEQARDKVMMGVERLSLATSEDERKLIAFHESGHAVVGHLVGDHDPLHKISIIPRGKALGVTVFLPEEDRHSETFKQIMARLCSLYGGRCAEELIWGKESITTGAANDIQVATGIARNMVTKWGLSEKMGAVRYDTEDSADPFLGRRMSSNSHNVSNLTAELIDNEIKRILDSSYVRAMALLRKNKSLLSTLAEALLAHETLDVDQIATIMSGGILPPPPEPASARDRNAPRPRDFNAPVADH
ncbi:MAG: ATP-dependent zinc metalloprotease FtsH [Gammaproteobacteria bacterium]